MGRWKIAEGGMGTCEAGAEGSGSEFEFCRWKMEANEDVISSFGYVGYRLSCRSGGC